MKDDFVCVKDNICRTKPTRREIINVYDRFDCVAMTLNTFDTLVRKGVKKLGELFLRQRGLTFAASFSAVLASKNQESNSSLHGVFDLKFLLSIFPTFELSCS